MKKLSHLILPAILTFSIFTIVTYSACKQDKCKDIICTNGGSCSDGTCICPDGYSGPRCEIVDPCKDVICLNNGQCDNGDCDCTYEYEGDSCQKEIRANYAKTYEGTRRYEQDTLQPGWRLKLSTKGDDPKLMEAELLNLVDVVWQKYEIVLTGSNEFDVPQQNLRNTSIKGSGTISSNILKVNLTVKSLPDTTKVYQEYYEMTAQ